MTFDQWWATLETMEQRRADKEFTREAFAAGAASRDAEVAEHIEEITALKEVIKHGDAQRERDMELAGEERDQLRAQINVLRELLHEGGATITCHGYHLPASIAEFCWLPKMRTSTCARGSA